jgi:hypothetical protein
VAVDDHCALWSVSILPLYVAVVCDAHTAFRADQQQGGMTFSDVVKHNRFDAER